jgi:LmeA-like phospholipid-binding
MAPNDSDLGEKALSKVAEVGIASQLNEAEDINVDIRTNPGKLVQGKLDSVSISGKGLVMKQDLRMETLEVSIDKVEINPLSAVFGNIELVHPTDAEARIVLSEDDINRALSSDYIQNKLHNLQMNMDGHPVMVDVQESTISLPGDNKFVITADFLIKEQDEVKKLSATAIPQIQGNGHCISLEILSAEGQGLTSELIVVILEQITALLDLRNFDMPGMSLQMHQLDAQAGKLVIHAKTQIEQIPSV